MIFGARRSVDIPVFGQHVNVGDTPVPATVDMRAKCTFVGNQGQTESCVGQALSNAHFLAVPGTQRASALSFWRGARVRERARTGDLITNVGCQPVDAVNDAIATGTYARDQYDTASELGQSVMNSMETWSEATKKQQFSASDFVMLQDGDSASAMLWLSKGYGIAAPLEIGNSFFNVNSWDIYNGTDAPVGGHDQCAIGYDADSIWYWGSYGSSFGQNGFLRVAWSFYEAHSFDAIVVLGGPKL
jgi:hypothetical protein